MTRTRPLVLTLLLAGTGLALPACGDKGGGSSGGDANAAPGEDDGDEDDEDDDDDDDDDDTGGHGDDTGGDDPVLSEDDLDCDGYSPAEGDCDDTTALARPGMPELPSDGLDNDCADDGDGEAAEDGLLAGIFVSPAGDDGAAGTRAAPVRTIARGVALAQSAGGYAVYIAAGTYTENVITDVDLYGGFDDADWSRDPSGEGTIIDGGTHLAVTVGPGESATLDGLVLLAEGCAGTPVMAAAGDVMLTRTRVAGTECATGPGVALEVSAARGTLIESTLAHTTSSITTRPDLLLGIDADIEATALTLSGYAAGDGLHLTGGSAALCQVYDDPPGTEFLDFHEVVVAENAAVTVRHGELGGQLVLRDSDVVLEDLSITGRVLVTDTTGDEGSLVFRNSTVVQSVEGAATIQSESDTVLEGIVVDAVDDGIDIGGEWDGVYTGASATISDVQVTVDGWSHSRHTLLNVLAQDHPVSISDVTLTSLNPSYSGVNGIQAGGHPLSVQRADVTIAPATWASGIDASGGPVEDCTVTVEGRERSGGGSVHPTALGISAAEVRNSDVRVVGSVDGYATGVRSDGAVSGNTVQVEATGTEGYGFPSTGVEVGASSAATVEANSLTVGPCAADCTGVLVGGGGDSLLIGNTVEMNGVVGTASGFSTEPHDGRLTLVGNLVTIGDGAANIAGFDTFAPSPGVQHEVLLVNNTFVLGESSGLTWGVESTARQVSTLVNNTVVVPADSTAVLWVEGFADAGSSLTLLGNDLWSPGTATLVGFHALSGGLALTDAAAIDACDWAGCAEASGTLSVDPLFVDAAAGDYHLQSTSPLIDAGVDPTAHYSASFSDIDGDARPQAAGWDIGHDEVP